MYLPEEFTQDTEFPRAFGKDLHTQVRMIEEQYRRMYPQIRYFTIQSNVDEPADAPASNTEPLQVAGQTGFDPLYRESIDPTIAQSGAWQQPHGDDQNNAVNAGVDQFIGPSLIHGRVQRETRERELKRLGFDQVRDILLFLPNSLLDRCGITVRPGDEFEWDGDRYIVKQDRGAGWWKNTNIRLFTSCSCEHRRPGS